MPTLMNPYISKLLISSEHSSIFHSNYFFENSNFLRRSVVSIESSEYNVSKWYENVKNTDFRTNLLSHFLGLTLKRRKYLTFVQQRFNLQ
jgi:hypothetical protein